MHVCVGTHQRQGCQTLTMELKAVMSCLGWVLEPNSGPVQEQQDFLTAVPFLQPRSLLLTEQFDLLFVSLGFGLGKFLRQSLSV